MFLFSAPAMYAQQGVVFEDLTIEQALAKAAKENKYVFVDCYTSWCGPCKNMTDNVFPQQKVGDYFNPRFISVKYDVEKEEEGIRIAREHEVRAYPTFLVLNPDGSLLHKILGGGDADKFLRRVDESFDDGKALGSLKRAYEGGDRNRGFLEKALAGFTSVRDPQTQEVMAELVGRLSDKEKISPDYWFIYATDLLDTVGSKNERFLFDNAAKFRKRVGADRVDPVLERHYKARLTNIIRLQEDISMKDTEKMAREIGRLGLGGDTGALARIAVAVKSGDMDRMISVATAEMPGMDNWLEPYFMLSDRVKDNGTVEQNRAWVALGETLTPLAPADTRVWMDAVVKMLREKAGL